MLLTISPVSKREVGEIGNCYCKILQKVCRKMELKDMFILVKNILNPYIVFYKMHVPECFEDPG